MTKVYLAGPDVFLPDAVEAGRRKVRLAAERLKSPLVRASS
jgi:nucleoside 2-deoxyribosyltransferase